MPSIGWSCPDLSVTRSANCYRSTTHCYRRSAFPHRRRPRRADAVPERTSMRTRFAASAALIGLSVAATIAIVSGAPAGAAPTAAAAAAPVWKTEFRDDFSGTGLPNPANWLLTLGTAYPGGPANFGTGEIQTMTKDPKNVDVRNGR